MCVSRHETQGPASVHSTTGWWLCHSAKKWNQPPGVTCLMPGWSARADPAALTAHLAPQARRAGSGDQACQVWQKTRSQSGHPFLPGLPKHCLCSDTHRYSGRWKNLETLPGGWGGGSLQGPVAGGISSHRYKRGKQFFLFTEGVAGSIHSYSTYVT